MNRAERISADQPQLLGYGILLHDRRTFRRLVRNLLIGGATLILLAYTVLPMWSRRQYKINARIQCSLEMRQICWAAMMYARDHKRRLPDDLDTIFQFSGFNPETFVCTGTEADLPSAPTTQAVYSALKQGGSISYIYLGNGVTLDSPDDTVILCEPLDNHDIGINIGFLDCTTE
jgi:hypothetical protein